MTVPPPRPHVQMFLSLLILSSVVRLASAWSFNISSRVAQCANLSVTWDGGVAPWEVVLVPVGALQGPEIRTIVDANVTEGNSYSFQLKFPTNSSFLAMMSDATGVGTGGTSDLITVLDGDDSCLAKSATSPLFYLYLDPQSSPAECSSLDVGWQSTNSQGQVRITAMLPGGTSFALPVPSTGSSFNWTVDMRQGTEYLIVAGDSRGFGTGGSSELTTVGAGSSGCINGASPSSTAAPAAGGIYATGSGGGSVTGVPGGQPLQSGAPGSGTSTKSTSNVGAIVGGVIGGIAGLAILGLLILFCVRRRRLRREGAATKGRKRDDVDLLHGEPRAEPAAAEAAVGAEAMRETGHNRNQASISTAGHTNTTATGLTAPIWRSRRSSAPSIPPLDFGASAASDDLSHEATSAGGQRPTSTRTSSGAPPSAFFNSSSPGAGRPTTPTSTSGINARSGKGPLPGMRPVNVVVHDDAGQVPQPGASQSPTGDEIVELPPSYADVRRNTGA